MYKIQKSSLVIRMNKHCRLNSQHSPNTRNILSDEADYMFRTSETVSNNCNVPAFHNNCDVTIHKTGLLPWTRFFDAAASFSYCSKVVISRSAILNSSILQILSGVSLCSVTHRRKKEKSFTITVLWLVLRTNRLKHL